MFFSETMKKEIIVSFGPEFEEEYNSLLSESEKEKMKGISNSFNMQLLKAIDRAIELLKIQPDYGIHIPKNLIPKKFIEKYGINNLWKVNIPHGWRLLYTLSTGKLEIITILLEFMDHDEYNKLFGYKKR